MTDKWISVDDAMPDMHKVSGDWFMSDTVLALLAGKYPVLATFNSNMNKREWLFIGKGELTHWQYIDIPKDLND